MININYAEIKKYDVANSPYVGSTLFVSGCTNNCEGCFNTIAKDFNYGNQWTNDTEDLFIKYLQNEQVKNANILGGEPMQQNSDTILHLVKRIKNETNVDIWCWTGLLFEDLIKQKDKLEILKCIDVLIDGKFVLSKRDSKLKYRGSSNQRVIDVQKSLKENKVILYYEED